MLFLRQNIPDLKVRKNLYCYFMIFNIFISQQILVVTFQTFKLATYTIAWVWNVTRIGREMKEIPKTHFTNTLHDRTLYLYNSNTPGTTLRHSTIYRETRGREKDKQLHVGLFTPWNQSIDYSRMASPAKDASPKTAVKTPFVPIHTNTAPVIWVTHGCAFPFVSNCPPVAATTNSGVE